MFVIPNIYIFIVFLQEKCIKSSCIKSNTVFDNGFLSDIVYNYLLHKETEYKCKPGYATADGKSLGTVMLARHGLFNPFVSLNSFYF